MTNRSRREEAVPELSLAEAEAAVDALSLYARIRPPSVANVKAELEELDNAARYRANHPRAITFQQAAELYLAESHDKPGKIGRITYHVTRLLPFIGQLPISEIHMGTLAPFIKSRLENDGASRRTVALSLETVRRILLLCARTWRDANGKPLLAQAPIIKLDVSPQGEEGRRAYELSWEEQDVLLAALPPEPQRQMAEFVLNTGTLEHEVCSLQWSWEATLPGLGASVFLIPNRSDASRSGRLVVLNETARGIVDARRGIHRDYVFSWRRDRPRHVGEADPREGQPVGSMNNSAWRSARDRAAIAYEEQHGVPAPTGFKNVRLLDLKHTFACRLRAAAVSEDLRKILLGNLGRGKEREHYSAAEMRRLLSAVRKIMRRTVSRFFAIKQAEPGRPKAT